MLSAYNTVRKLYFYKLISFSVLITLPVNVNIFDRTFEGISFLTCESTETGAVTQRVNKSQCPLNFSWYGPRDSNNMSHDRFYVIYEICTWLVACRQYFPYFFLWFCRCFALFYHNSWSSLVSMLQKGRSTKPFL